MPATPATKPSEPGGAGLCITKAKLYSCHLNDGSQHARTLEMLRRDAMPPFQVWSPAQ